MSEGIVTSSKDAAVGGYQSIVKVEGVLEPLRRVDGTRENPFAGKVYDQVEIKLSDAVVLEVLPGEEMPDLNDNTFRTWYNYAPKGKPKPHKNNSFIRGFVKSFEDAGTTVDDKVGERIILKFARFPLGFKVDKKDEDGNIVFDDDGKPVKEEAQGSGFVYCPDGDADVAPITDHIKNLVVGKTPAAAKRAVLMDGRARRYPEYKEAIDTGRICEMLGLVESEDGIYQEA